MALLEKMPTNARIATALIQVLGESGDVGGRARALRSVGPEGGGLRAPHAWIQENALREMFRSLPADSKLARRVGRALVTPAETGLFLCFSGVATSEKAYRRCDQLLARESREARYEAAEISSGRARIVFHPAARQSARQSLPEPLFCSVRQGMLEAIPLLFGLLPAVVRETKCAARGAEQCVFEVSWSRSSRVGLASGLLLGSAAGAAFGFLALPGSAGWVPVLTTLALAALSAMAGRSVDLARQLRVVAGARRGQLALLDQADRTLAEKMDELAKLGALLNTASDEASRQRGDSGREHLEEPARREPADVGAIVRRAVESVRPRLPSSLRLEVDVDPDTPEVQCVPSQIEQVMEQLLENASRAMQGEGAVHVSVRTAGGGVELSVEDCGVGMEGDTVDRVFDPFLAEPVAGEGSELGFTRSCRILERHGGELRIESEPGRGTRVTACIPLD